MTARKNRNAGWIRWSVVAVLGALAAGLIAGYVVGRRADRTIDGLPWLGETETIEGTWGKIRYWRSLLEMPAALIAENSAFVEETNWLVGLPTKEAIGQMFDRCGMNAHLRDELLTRATAASNGGFVLRPTDAMVLAIPPDVRGKFYTYLLGWPGNETYGISTRFGREGKLDWLDRSELPREVVEMTRKLIYTHGEIEMFADYNVVLHTIKDNRIARRFLRVMSRQSSIMGSLVVGPGEDLDKLAAYWGRGGRETEVRTLLEAASMSEGSHEIPISMLLPPFAKDRIYRYKHPGDPDNANCHYSAMNFFSAKPEESFTDLVKCAHEIDTNYIEVSGERRLGDVILFMRNEREVVHSCNVIAGDLVFTKNGGAAGQPWVVRTLDKLKPMYEVDQPIKMMVIRRRDMAGAP